MSDVRFEEQSFAPRQDAPARSKPVELLMRAGIARSERGARIAAVAIALGIIVLALTIQAWGGGGPGERVPDTVKMEALRKAEAMLNSAQ